MITSKDWSVLSSLEEGLARAYGEPILGLYLLLVMARGSSHLLGLAESGDINFAEVVGFSPVTELETLR